MDGSIQSHVGRLTTLNEEGLVPMTGDGSVIDLAAIRATDRGSMSDRFGVGTGVLAIHTSAPL